MKILPAMSGASLRTENMCRPTSGPKPIEVTVSTLNRRRPKT
jgi:hypothetical protein